MMFSLLSWFILAALMGTLTLWAVWSRSITRWRSMTVVAFLISIFVSGAAIFLSQGWATQCGLLLPGKYNLLTFQAVPDEAIYLFLETNYGPKVCYINWDPDKSDELEENEGENGSEFEISWGEGEGSGSGIPGIDGDIGNVSPRPPATHAPKPPEEQEGIM